MITRQLGKSDLWITMTGAIVGVRSPEEAAQMLDGADWRLSDDEIAQVRAALEQPPAAK